jgi:predicted nucleotidyltransferase
VAYENNDKKMESVYSQRIRAGKRRTYFFDVRETRGNDYYLTITESRKKFNEDGYDRHKIFLYKEDFNKFLKGMTEAIDYVKTDLMPDFDFDAFNHENSENYEGNNYPEKKSEAEQKREQEPEQQHPDESAEATKASTETVANTEKPETQTPDEPWNPIQHEEVDKW